MLQTKKLASVKANRNEAEVQRCLAALKEAAVTPPDIVCLV